MSNKSTVRKIYSNGKYVGNYESTNDLELDTKLVLEQLDKLGLRRPPSRLNSMHAQAEAFAEAAKIIFDQNLVSTPINPKGLSPFIVNATFGAEMYLKTIHAVHSSNVTGHNLTKLYKQLPNKVKDTIEKKSKELDFNYNIESEMPFLYHVKMIANAFVEWRYMYEKTDLQYNVQSIIYILHTLHEVCSTEVKKISTP